MNGEAARQLLSAHMQREEDGRSRAARDHRFECVPWRGAGGEIGKCIYCGSSVDAITAYYTDRANSGLAALAR